MPARRPRQAAADSAARGPADQAADLDELRAAAAGCRACDLWERATQTVCGEGLRRAEVMLVGVLASGCRKGKGGGGSGGYLGSHHRVTANA